MPYGGFYARDLSTARFSTRNDDTHTPPEDVNVHFRGETVRTPKGTTLRSALLKQGLSPHNGNSKLINCRGIGTCGTCAVEISHGDVTPTSHTWKETTRLALPPHSRSPENLQRLRLACQCRVQSDISVVKHR